MRSTATPEKCGRGAISVNRPGAAATGSAAAGAAGAATAPRAGRAGARPFSSLQVSGMPSSAASWP